MIRLTWPTLHISLASAPYQSYHASPAQPWSGNGKATNWEDGKPTYIIEREVPGASQLSEAEHEVVDGLGVPYRWVTSYVAGDKIYCVHETDDAETVYRHAREGGFPANKVTPVAAFIGPETATGPTS